MFSSNLPNCLDIFIGPPSVKSGLNLSCQANAGVSFIHTYILVGRETEYIQGFDNLSEDHKNFENEIIDLG